MFARKRYEIAVVAAANAIRTEDASSRTIREFQVSRNRFARCVLRDIRSPACIFVRYHNYNAGSSRAKHIVFWRARRKVH